MTNKQKSELKALAKEGLTFAEIKELVDCADSTIRMYMRLTKEKGLLDEG